MRVGAVDRDNDFDTHVSRRHQHMQSLLVNHRKHQLARIRFVIRIVSHQLRIVQHRTHSLSADAALEHALERMG